jgi:hypothetical protein
MVIGLLVSVGALLLVAGAVARHVLRERRKAGDAAIRDAQAARHKELDAALDLGESTKSESP